MKAILISLLLHLPVIVIGQEAIAVRGSTIEVGLFVDGLDTSKYNDVDGTPYINDTFIPAKINELSQTQFIRFNIVDQIVEVKTKENKIVLLDLKNDFEIQLLDGSNKKYVTAELLKEKKKIKSFFEVIGSGKDYTLYKQEQKKYVKKQKAEGYQEKLPARFVDREPKFFISDFTKNSTLVIELPKKKKKFLALFGKEAKSVDNYIRTEKLKLNTSQDLLKIFEFYHNEVAR